MSTTHPDQVTTLDFVTAKLQPILYLENIEASLSVFWEVLPGEAELLYRLNTLGLQAYNIARRHLNIFL